MEFSIGLILGYFLGIAVELYIQRYEKEWIRKHGE